MPTHILEWSPSQLRKNTHLTTNADGGAGGVGGDGHGVADMKAVDPRRLWPAHVPAQWLRMVMLGRLVHHTDVITCKLNNAQTCLFCYPFAPTLLTGSGPQACMFWF